jgi:hypothetical protein
MKRTLNPLFGSFQLPLALFSMNNAIDVRDYSKIGTFATNSGTNVRAQPKFTWESTLFRSLYYI